MANEKKSWRKYSNIFRILHLNANKAANKPQSVLMVFWWWSRFAEGITSQIKGDVYPHSARSVEGKRTNYPLSKGDNQEGVRNWNLGAGFPGCRMVSQVQLAYISRKVGQRLLFVYLHFPILQKTPLNRVMGTWICLQIFLSLSPTHTLGQSL